MKSDNTIRWDIRYKEKTHHSTWPWSDLVSLCERYVRPNLSKASSVHILEVGCGFGANIPYLLTVGDNYYGIDGSETCLKEIADRFPSLAINLRCADFTKDLIFNTSFDLIVDRASITHNSDQSIRDSVQLIYAKLRPGGYFCGVAWFSKENSEFTAGQDGADEHTRKGYLEGPYAHVGNVHFTDNDNLRGILSNFEIVKMEHKVTHEIVPASGSINAFFNFVARKT